VDDHSEMFIHRCRQQHAYTERIRWFRLIHSIFFFFIFRYYFVVHDSGMVPAKLPALLRSSLLHFCLFKTKTRIFTDSPCLFAKDLLILCIKKKTTTNFSFLPRLIEATRLLREARFGQVKIIHLSLSCIHGVSLSRAPILMRSRARGRDKCVQKRSILFGNHLGPVQFRVVLRGVMSKIYNRVEKYICN